MVKHRDLSQEEIDKHFAVADKLFAGKKFEDGAVVERRCPHDNHRCNHECEEDDCFRELEGS